MESGKIIIIDPRNIIKSLLTKIGLSKYNESTLQRGFTSKIKALQI